MEGQSNVSQEKKQKGAEARCEALPRREGVRPGSGLGVAGGGFVLEAECEPWGSAIWGRPARKGAGSPCQQGHFREREAETHAGAGPGRREKEQLRDEGRMWKGVQQPESH